MPYVEGYTKIRVWVPPGLPGLPDLPDRPDRPEPPEVQPPWVPDVPGIGGGPILPGRPELPPLPERPERPDIPVYPVIDPGDVGGHPAADELDLNATRRIAVSDGDNVFPAYVIVSGDSDEPRHPSKGLPGSWVTVAYHGAVCWAWSPTLTLPERPDFGRPDQGLPPGIPEREPK